MNKTYIYLYLGLFFIYTWRSKQLYICICFILLSLAGEILQKIIIRRNIFVVFGIYLKMKMRNLEVWSNNVIEPANKLYEIL